MKSKKILALTLSAVMTLGSASAVFAAAPSDYDGQTYGSLGYTSSDPDGEFNLAVIANGDVRIYGDAMYIKGSVYSNGTIYAGNGQGNKIDGLFISKTENTVFASDNNNNEWTQYRTAEGFVHVDDYGKTDGINYYSAQVEHEGAVLDKDTSFGCTYTEFDVPTIANSLGDKELTVYGNEWANNEPMTVTKDTHFGTVTMNGTQNNWRNYDAALTIDTTDGDVTVVIDKLIATNPSIKVVGSNKANIYIGNVERIDNLAFNYNTNNYDENWQPMPVINGSTENTTLYLSGTDIVLDHSYIAANKIYVNAKSLKVSGSANVTANIDTSASRFIIEGGNTEVTGVVCAPNAESSVDNSGTLYGQIHTDTLVINGAGSIIWKADAGVAVAEKTPEPTTEPTTAPTVEPTTEPTVEPTATPEVVLPTGKTKDYTDFRYAYIFGYEPYDGDDGVVLDMAPNDKLTREQVCAMLVRVDDQYNDNVGKTRVLEDDIFNGSATPDRWSYNALAAVAETNAFHGLTDLDPAGHVSRGEVAKIVAFMVGLKDYDDEISFTDIYGDENAPYIKLVAKAGYMQGYEDGSFKPAAAITRAEFCSLLNNIIGRTADNGYELVTADGDEVTHQTYHFRDLKPSAWYYETMLYATSAFTNKKVDLELRNKNIRNKLDIYDAQYDY